MTITPQVSTLELEKTFNLETFGLKRIQFNNLKSLFNNLNNSKSKSMIKNSM